PRAASRAVPHRLDARGRRGHARHHVDGLAADRGAGPGGGHPADRGGRAGGAGTQLTEPDGRRVRLTPAGRRLAGHAITILAAVEAARRDLDPAAAPAGTGRAAAFAAAVRQAPPPV